MTSSNVAQKVHGSWYDYSETEYLGRHSKLRIICPDHGSFAQEAGNHLQGSGCSECGEQQRRNLRRKGTDQFVAEACEIHGDRYDYSLTEYTGARRKLTIICPDHGRFEQISGDHLSGRGCRACGNDRKVISRTKSQEQFLMDARSAHGDRYSYPEKYSSARMKIKIICPEHGSFRQTAIDHTTGKGCPICANEVRADKLRKTTEEAVEEFRVVHGDQYDYSLVEYHTNNKPVSIICSNHGQFEQAPFTHLAGSGCPDCAETGFKMSEPGILYYLKVETRNQTLYKIGITGQLLKDRFKAFDMDKITVLQTWNFENGAEAFEREREYLNRYKEFVYRGAPILISGGNSELFTKDILGLDKSAG